MWFFNKSITKLLLAFTSNKSWIVVSKLKFSGITIFCSYIPTRVFLKPLNNSVEFYKQIE